ncbi:MAG: hypothetical protein DDG60_05340 [Anaerolineae bacterium]|nr:MAG: hypothetical protein DDG60_05340 [Anaerolineae bacterium]
MKTMRRFLLIIVFALALTVALACSPQQPQPQNLPATANQSASMVTQAAVVPSATPTPEPPTATPTPQPPTETPTPAFPPPEPQEVTFEGSKGALYGRYYPAAASQASLVVLIHWVRGDMNDWNEIAVWLQNRGLQNPYPNPGNAPWWAPAWFPAMPEGRSYAVFTFSLTGCQPGGCADWTPDIWRSDIAAAMRKAAELPGVDPQHIVVIGSSIGADGAVSGCDVLNQMAQANCPGALSLSPGGYLNVSYRQAVEALFKNNPQSAAWCLADEKEFGFCQVEQSAVRAVKIPGGGHGTELLRPNLDPLPMQLILDFLAQTLGQ